MLSLVQRTSRRLEDMASASEIKAHRKVDKLEAYFIRGIGVVGRYILNDTCEIFNRLIGKDYRIHLRHLPASFCNGFGDELASLFNGIRFFSAFQRADAFIDGC